MSPRHVYSKGLPRQSGTHRADPWLTLTHSFFLSFLTLLSTPRRPGVKGCGGAQEPVVACASRRPHRSPFTPFPRPFPYGHDLLGKGALSASAPPPPVIKTESPSTPFPKHRLVADSTEDVDVNGRGTQPRGCPQGRPLETNRKGQKCHTPASCWGQGRLKPGERGARGPAHGGGFVLSAALSLVAAGAAACPRSPARPLPAVLPRHARRERVSKHLVSFAARPTPRSRRRQLPPQG